MNTRPSLDRCRERRARVLRGERVMGEQEACPVCTEPLREDGDDSLRCLNRHRMCLLCAGKMVKPCGECKPATCTGVWFTCPLCTGSHYSVVSPSLPDFATRDIYVLAEEDAVRVFPLLEIEARPDPSLVPQWRYDISFHIL